MWQRFTERARRVVFFAQEEAGNLGENYVSTEHLLLGLARENDSVAARILERMQIPLSSLRAEIERQVARGDGRAGQDMQLTPRAKRVIDLAYEEANLLNNNYIGTEHLLLGMLREGEGLAGRVLVKLGANLDRVRLEVIQLQNSDPSNEGSPATQRRREVMQEILDRVKAGSELGAALSEVLASESTTPGDLGKVRAPEGRDHVEVALDASAFVHLADIFAARDSHGYRAMAQGDQTMFLIENGAPLKCLITPAGGDLAAAAGGMYVRVLSGVYEGYAGWIFASTFARTGPDESPFPPPFY